jgi:hypothetical protein
VAFLDPVDFNPSQEGSDVGVVQLPLSKNVMRIRSMVWAGKLGALETEAQSGMKLLNRFTFAVTIFAPKPGGKPLSRDEVAQLFHDFNFRVRPVSRQHAIALDSSDIYISLANRIGEKPPIAPSGGVAKKARSLGSKSTELVTQHNLVRFVRGATEGPKFQTSSADYLSNPNLTRENFPTMLESLTTFLATVAEEMADKFTNKDSLHLTALGWQALGVLHYDIVVTLGLTGDARRKAIKALAMVDWSRSNTEFIGLIGVEEIGPDGKPRLKPGATRRQDIEALFKYLRDKAGLTALLLAKQQAPEAAAA